MQQECGLLGGGGYRKLSADPAPTFVSCPHCRRVPLKGKEDGLLFQKLPRKLAEARPLLGWRHLPSCAWQLPVWARKGKESPEERDGGGQASPLH